MHNSALLRWQHGALKYRSHCAKYEKCLCPELEIITEVRTDRGILQS